MCNNLFMLPPYYFAPSQERKVFTARKYVMAVFWDFAPRCLLHANWSTFNRCLLPQSSAWLPSSRRHPSHCSSESTDCVAYHSRRQSSSYSSPCVPVSEFIQFESKYLTRRYCSFVTSVQQNIAHVFVSTGASCEFNTESLSEWNKML